MANKGSRTAGILLFNVVVIAALIAGAISGAAFATSQTFTGTVGDAMCGEKHVMPGDAVACTKECVSKGSKYALLAGDKAYVLEIADKALLATLDQRAGEKVVITGTLKDDTITVASVKDAP